MAWLSIACYGDVSTDTKAANVEGASGETSEKTSEKTLGEILALIRENPVITISELALSIGVTERPIERNLKKLRGENLLSRIGPAKGGHWKASA